MKLSEISGSIDKKFIDQWMDTYTNNAYQIMPDGSVKIPVIDALKVEGFKGEVLPFKFADCDRMRVEHCYISSFTNFPDIIRYRLYLEHLPRLKNFVGMPHLGADIGADLEAMNIGIESFEGMPREFDGDIKIVGCDQLSSLKGFPRDVAGNVTLALGSFSKLTSLRGCPDSVKTMFIECGSSLNEIGKLPISAARLNIRIRNISDETFEKLKEEISDMKLTYDVMLHSEPVGSGDSNLFVIRRA